MKFIQEIKKFKLGFIIITYSFILLFITLHYNKLIDYVHYSFNLIKPVIFGVALAYVLNLPMSAIEKFLKPHLNPKLAKKFLRPFSILLSLLIFFILLLIVGFLVIPQLISTVYDLIVNIQNLIQSFITNIDSILNFFNIDIKYLNELNIEKLLKDFGINYQSLVNNTTAIINSLSSNLIATILSISDLLINFFFSLVTSIYLLAAKEKMLVQLKKVIYGLFSLKYADRIYRVAYIFNNIFKSFTGGQLVECCILGLMIYIALIIAGLPYAPLIAVLTAFFAIIPIFGAMISLLIGFILIMAIDPIKAIIFYFVYQFVQQIENNFVYPRVVGNSVGLPALWTLISIVIFGSLFGLVGMIIAVPFTASIYSIISILIKKHLAKKKIHISNNGHIIIKE